MSQATTQSYLKEKSKELEVPCDRYGDHVAINAMVIHFWVATIVGWTFPVVGLLSVALTGQIHPVAWVLFAWGILAQGGAFITLMVHIYKQLTKEKR